MKTCTKCGTEKQLNEFHKRGNGTASWCKTCKKDKDKEYNLSPEQKARKKQRQEKRQFANRFLVSEYLRSHPCIDCGESDPIVLEFDHRDRETKEYNVSKAVLEKTAEQLIAEINKCDVRCANCHRRRTAYQMGWWIRDEPVTISDPFNLLSSEAKDKMRNSFAVVWLKGYKDI